ncbi:hypothetical protein NKI88_31000, partial [Mesorhizobium sp. M0317]
AGGGGVRVGPPRPTPPPARGGRGGGGGGATLGSTAGTAGLAIARIDRVKAALDAGQPVLAGDVTVSLAIPSWAKFSFPREAIGAEDA